MIIPVVILAFIATAWSVPLDSHWNNFRLSHGKFYQSPKEESYRLQVFQDNLKKIEEHNKRYEAGLTTYRMGITRFADLTDEEFVALTSTAMVPPLRNKSADDVFKVRKDADIPESVDWRDKNAVNKVRDQAGCGSCWAFTAVECLESLLYIKTGRMVTLSPQNIVDCAVTNGGYGCRGGFMDVAYDYIKDNGIMYDDQYPYTAKDGECKFNATKNVIPGGLSGYKWVEATEEGLKAAVAEIGPIGVAVDAKEWHLYESGIFHPNESFKVFTHGVVVVGYGTENGVDYWILRNSYGEDFGEKGYMRVARKGENDIGVTKSPIYPTINY